MDGLKSLDELISDGSFPQKESTKEKTEVQKPTANRTIDNRPIGRVARVSTPPVTGVEQTEQATEHKQMALDQSELAKAERRSRSIQTLEIDEYLLELVMDGLLSEDFVPYAAKVCYTLGLQRVNKLVLQVRNATFTKEGQSPMRLLAWKFSGAMQLHYKKLHFQELRERGER